MKVRFAVAPEATGVRSGARLIAFAEAIEASGFDGVWLSDLPLGPTVDPLIGLALIAARTRALRLGANVVPLGRNPFLLAKALAQLDQLSEGRLLLSFVPGIDQAGERRALGWDGASRGAVLEATLARVRAWWAGQGAEGDAALAEIVRPVQDPLEVWLGGRGPQALERVGRIADGWLGALVTPPITSNILESITRDTILELARDVLKIPVQEREIDRTEMYIADEAFFCGSGAEVTPINSVDHYPVGTGKPGPVTKRLQETYFAVAEGRVPQYRHWLTPVYGGVKAAARG